VRIALCHRVALLSDPLYLTSMGSFDREALIDRMVRLIIDPANPQIARNTRKNRGNKRA